MKKVQYKTVKGVMQWRPVLTGQVEDMLYSDENVGFCLACGAEADSVEPDARKYTCESCKAPKVYGLSELLTMGLLR